MAGLTAAMMARLSTGNAALVSVTEFVSFQQRLDGWPCGLRWTVEGESLATVVAELEVRA